MSDELACQIAAAADHDARSSVALPRSRAVDFEAAGARFLDWLRSHGGGWIAISDHHAARLAGLTDSDQGMRLLDQLAADRSIEIEHDDIRRSIRLSGPARARAAITPAMVAAVRAAAPSPIQPRPRPAPATAAVVQPIPSLQTPEVAMPATTSPPKRAEFKFRPPVALQSRLRDHAVANGRTMNDVVVNAVERALAGAAGPIPGEDALRPSLRRAVDLARTESVEIGALLAELIDFGLTLRRSARGPQAAS